MKSLYAKRNESGSYNKVSCLKQGGEMSNYCLKQGQAFKDFGGRYTSGVLSIYLIFIKFRGSLILRFSRLNTHIENSNHRKKIIHL